MITVGEVYLPVIKDKYSLVPSGELRAFQEQFIDCINQNEADVIQLIAPTGAGKTLCFEYLLKQDKKVLLLYPTNALIQSQMRRFDDTGFKVINISGKILAKKGYERARELSGLIHRYDIILANPDVFQAIIGSMYYNPEEDLIQAFHQFEYIIYDEFHAYREFELSGILTQIALAMNMSSCKIILSSATPKSEIIELLNLVKIGKNRHVPIVANVLATPCNPDEGVIIRHHTLVEFHQGKLIDKFNEVADILLSEIKEIEIGKPRILLIFDTVKDSNQFYTRLFYEYPEIYKFAEKDNGYDTNQIGKSLDFTKPILISTNKSEVGLDYPIKLLFMEDGFSIDSFVQRFGRAARHESAKCYLCTKKEVSSLFTEEIMSYQKFLDTMSYATDKYNIQIKSVRTLFTLRQALAIQEYKRRKEDLMAYFSAESGLSYKLWLTFFSILNKYNDEKLSNTSVERLNLFLNDIKNACKSLRGRSFQLPVFYQRGHEVRQTVYDILSIINRVPSVVENTKEGLILKEIESEESGPFIQAIIVPYLPSPLNYAKRKEQFRHEIETIAKRAVDVFNEKQQTILLACIYSLCDSIDIDRIVLPEEIILWNNKVIPLSKDSMEFYDNC